MNDQIFRKYCTCSRMFSQPASHHSAEEDNIRTVYMIIMHDTISSLDIEHRYHYNIMTASPAWQSPSWQYPSWQSAHTISWLTSVFNPPSGATTDWTRNLSLHCMSVGASRCACIMTVPAFQEHKTRCKDRQSLWCAFSFSHPCLLTLEHSLDYQMTYGVDQLRNKQFLISERHFELHNSTCCR